MNTPFEAALELVVRDLRNTGGITLHLLPEPVDSDPSYESVWMLSGRTARTGLLAPIEMAPPDRIVHIADQVQEFVLEELGRLGLPATWPECPEHPDSHPLTPTQSPGRPSWVCPKSGHTIAAIGQL
ncbi:hypothetical protein [Kribbella deserti]|uniref:Uncharacterized protein n=1 Tax=Kribbella deserti TaxID=1926257 RepID=A0ABV6QF16_9ACTN